MCTPYPLVWSGAILPLMDRNNTSQMTQGAGRRAQKEEKKIDCWESMA